MAKCFYEEGLHIGDLVQQAIGESGTGRPQIVLRVKILGTAIDDQSFTPHRQQFERTIYMTVTDKTIPFIIENLRVAGFDGDKISTLEPGVKNHVSLIGNRINLWCKHEEDKQGDLRERWQI